MQLNQTCFEKQQEGITFPELKVHMLKFNSGLQNIEI